MPNRISEYFKLRKQEKEQFQAFMEHTAIQISIAEKEYAALFRNTSRHLDAQTVLDWQNRFNKLRDEASSYLKDGMIEKKKLPRRYTEQFSKMDAMYESLPKRRKAHNQKLTEPHAPEAESAFLHIAGKKPEAYQKEAILSEERSLLLTGAPSTGKTTALKAKRQYLKERGLCSDDEIISLRCGDTAGFAALAADLLHTCGRPAEYQTETNRLPDKIRRFLREKTAEPSYRSRLIDYYLTFHVSGRTAFEFNTYEEYENYLTLCPPVSLKGEKLQSYEQLAVANFLYALGVEYEYHAPFREAVTLNGSRTPYKPDFTLKDYPLCINLYALDENGNAADKKALSFSRGETVTNQLQNRIREIREIHTEHEIPLIECFSYEKHAGNLLPKLQNALSAYNVKFHFRSDEELLSVIEAADPEYLETLTESIRCGTEAILASELTEDTVFTLSRTKSKTAAPLYKRRERLMSLILPFYREYLAEVPCDEYRIVSRAAEALKDYKPALRCRHLFLDDLENMNACSMHLVTAFYQLCGCTVTAAGSVQSSFAGRFGADSAFLAEFGRYFPGFEEIECKRVLDLPAGIFGQLRTFAGEKDVTRVGSASGHIETYRVSYTDQAALREACDTLFASLPPDRSVLVACRYDSDRALFAEYTADKSNTACLSVFDAVQKYDIVIWVNTRFSSFGVPDERLCLNNIAGLLMRKPDTYSYEEERGLLYRTLALARERAILLYDPKNESDFVKELGKAAGNE